MKKPSYLYFFLIVVLTYWGCQSPKPQNTSNVPDLKLALSPETFPYDLSEPEVKHSLPRELTEVSGLSYTPDSMLAMVQDEEGLLFLMDPKTGEVQEKTYLFEDRGDFEGIEIVNDTAYVLRSDGVVYILSQYQDSTSALKEVYKTPLQSRNDTEGLAYLASSHRLLIACKAVPNISGKKQKDHRAIYQFDLRSKKLSATPHIRIPVKHIHELINDSNYTRFSKDIVEVFSKGGDLSFQPSALAIHPLTSETYILASVGKLLIIVDKEGAIVNFVELDSSVFKQPEGICFAPNGDLYVSNEGKKGRGNVVKFLYQPPKTSDE